MNYLLLISFKKKQVYRTYSYASQMGWEMCIVLEIDESVKNINIEQNKHKPGCYSYEILK